MTVVPVTNSGRHKKPEAPTRYLRVADRCDRCGAQAFALTVVSDVDLLFCGHHFRKYEAALREVAEVVIDERWAINEKPTPSASR